VRRALGVAVAGALLAPAAAGAHATMKQAAPAVQSRVEASPTLISLRFDQSVTVVGRSIEVFAADGRRVSGRAVARRDGRVIVAPLRPGLPRGGYTVRWRTLSSDGHIGSGVFTFGVRVAAPSPTDAVGASGLTWKDDAARWAYFAALAVLLGALVTRLVLLPREVAPLLASRLNLVTAAAVFAVLNIGIAAFVLRGANVLQVSIVDLLYGDLSPLAESTRFGTAFMATTFGFGVVAALVILAWVFDRTRLLWPALLLGAALVAGSPMSGHQATETNSSPLTQGVDWVHLLAASIWAGGLAVVAACIWPLAPSLRRTVFVRFSRLATVLVGVIVLAGTYLSVVRLTDLADLWSTGYGRVLLLKLGLVGLAFGWGALHNFVVRPRLERGDPYPGVWRSLLGESAVAMAVLLAAAVLVNTPPPPPQSGAGATQASTD
jgi:copper transport protein